MGQTTESKRNGAPRYLGCGMLLFFTAFLVIGSVFSWIFFLKPVGDIMAAEDWVETPCQILRVELKSSPRRAGEKPSYRVVVDYRYEYEGERYASDRHSFVTFGSSSTGWRGDEVRRLKHAEAPVCYVNPADPSQAVLYRGWAPDLWFTPLTFLFVLIGGVGLFFTLRNMIRKRRGQPVVGERTKREGD